MSVSKSRPTTTTAGFPWEGDPRAEDKTAILEYIRYMPAGAPIPKIVGDVFGVEEGADTYQRDYKFARRFVEDADFLKIDRRQQLLHVEPRPSAFHLNSHKNHSNTRDVRRFPKDYAQNFLESVEKMTPARAQVLERQFLAYLEQIEDRWNILRRRNPGPAENEYALVPYSTLYNDESVSKDNWRRYHEAWENATREHSEAVFLTLTTDPGKFHDLDEMAGEMSDNFNRLKSWLRRRLADRCDHVGERGHLIEECPNCEEYAELPDNVKVLEWTDKGRPHLHVIFFGTDWLAPQQEISRYWGKYQAEVVDVRSVRRVPCRDPGDENRGIEVDGKTWEWRSKTTEDGETVTKNEKAHLGKYLSKNMPYDESLEELGEKAGKQALAGDSAFWKTVMYWATGRRFWTCSRSLKAEREEGDEWKVSYVYVGSAKAPKIPASVLSNATIIRQDRPPP